MTDTKTKRAQSGYINGIGTALVMLLIIAAVVGAAVMRLIEWVWPVIKAFIHQVTA
jgi:hypothetical protein